MPDITATRDGRPVCFDAMWGSSLTDATSRAKPDIEAVDISARLRMLEDVIEVTTKPLIFDGDTGGIPEHFVFTVKNLERLGVSAVIIKERCGRWSVWMWWRNCRSSRISVWMKP